MKKIKELFFKYKEIIMYLIIGVLTTVVNYITFVIVTNFFEEHISNIIAWIVSIIFAYFTNKLYVFESKSFKIDVIKKEIPSFVSSRIATLILEELILFIFVTKLEFNKYIIKLIANIIVIILNYILSKLMVFKKSKESGN